jgi:hypothetical protein
MNAEVKLHRLLAREDFSSNRHPALSFCLSMIFSENRYPHSDQIRGHAFPDHARTEPVFVLSAVGGIRRAAEHDRAATGQGSMARAALTFANGTTIRFSNQSGA